MADKSHGRFLYACASDLINFAKIEWFLIDFLRGDKLY